jgi:hypothetical protein
MQLSEEINSIMRGKGKGMRIHAMPGIFLFSIAFIGLLPGCGAEEKQTGSTPPPQPVAEAAAPAPERAAINMPPLPSDLQTTPGGELTAKIEVPDFYPADAPVYPNTRPSKAFVQGYRVNLMFGTEDSPSQAVAFLMDELRELGWSNASSQELGQSIAIQSTKPGRDLTILISRVDAGLETETTLVAVSVDR